MNLVTEPVINMQSEFEPQPQSQPKELTDMVAAIEAFANVMSKDDALVCVYIPNGSTHDRPIGEFNIRSGGSVIGKTLALAIMSKALGIEISNSMISKEVLEPFLEWLRTVDATGMQWVQELRNIVERSWPSLTN